MKKRYYILIRGYDVIQPAFSLKQALETRDYMTDIHNKSFSPQARDDVLVLTASELNEIVFSFIDKQNKQGE